MLWSLITCEELEARLFLAVQPDQLVLLPSPGGLWSRLGFFCHRGPQIVMQWNWVISSTARKQGSADKKCRCALPCDFVNKLPSALGVISSY